MFQKKKKKKKKKKKTIRVTTEVKISFFFVNFSIVAAQIKLIWFLQTSSEEKNTTFGHFKHFGLKSRDSGGIFWKTEGKLGAQKTREK